MKTCKTCGKKFKHIKGWKCGKYCSKKCLYNRENKKFSKKQSSTQCAKQIIKHKEIVKKEAFLENEFTRNQSKFIAKIITYPDSPTGKAYVGIAKHPLMKNKNGIGFQGVLLQTDNRAFVQCSGCGRWLKNINLPHIQACLGITTKEYKKKFGLNQGTGLVSDMMKKFFITNGINQLITNLKTYSYEQRAQNLKKGAKVRANKGGGNKFSREYQNLKGTCPEQLKARLIEYIHRFHRLPMRHRIHTGYRFTDIFRSRFGSFNLAMKHYGLPIRHKYNNIWSEYLFPDGYIFHIKHGLGYEELYTIMKQKCPILHTK